MPGLRQELTSQEVHGKIKKFLGRGWYMHNLDHVTSKFGLFVEMANVIDYFEEKKVPEEYWKEELKWFTFKELKEIPTVEEAKDKLSMTIREITERYVEERR